MTQEPISMDKEYRTRDGKDVRLYASDGLGLRRFHGAYMLEGWWQICCWDESGSYNTGSIPHQRHALDLIEVKPRIKRAYWLNIYEMGKRTPVLYHYRADAEEHSQPDRIACIKLELECEYGEGLE